MFHRAETTFHRVAVALALTLAGCAAGGGPTGAAGERVAVDRAEAHALVEAGATLLDVRTPAEFEARHLPGARLLPLAELGARMGEVPRARPVVVYCQSGGRAARATEMLRAAGYDARNLGGIDRW